jgi:hypothetical protein
VRIHEAEVGAERLGEFHAAERGGGGLASEHTLEFVVMSCELQVEGPGA